jgi:FG-GAP repeat
MSMQSEKKTTNVIKLPPNRIIPPFGGPPAILALMVSGLLVTAAQASTLLDPQPEDSTTRFGQSVAVVGDITGDGVPDLVVGGPFHDSEFDSTNGFGPPQDVGRAFLINGATLGELSELNDPFFQQPLNVPKFGGFFAFSVAAVGDVNHDDVPDVLVGVPHHSNFDLERINCGEAMVFSGADQRVLFTLLDPDEDEGNRFGYSVAGLGDVNGDGTPDLLVGVPKANGASEDDVGIAYIFSGANGSLIRSLNPPTEVLGGRFGTAVANAGDVNHDGVNDAIIGAPGASRAFVFNGATGALIFTITNPSPPAQEKLPSFGAAVAGGQDIDGDGTPDFVIGAPNQNSLRGAAYVFKGSDGTLLRNLKNPTHQFSKFGTSVAVSPDVTGDHRPDVLVGAPDATVNGLQNAGEVLVYKGNNGKVVNTVISEQPTAYAGFGYSVTSADFNNDGTYSIVVGVPFQDENIIVGGDVETHLQVGQIEIH